MFSSRRTCFRASYAPAQAHCACGVPNVMPHFMANLARPRVRRTFRRLIPGYEETYEARVEEFERREGEWGVFKKRHLHMLVLNMSPSIRHWLLDDARVDSDENRSALDRYIQSGKQEDMPWWYRCATIARQHAAIMSGMLQTHLQRMRTGGTRVITKRQARARFVTDAAGSSPSMYLHAQPQTACNETSIQSYVTTCLIATSSSFHAFASRNCHSELGQREDTKRLL